MDTARNRSTQTRPAVLRPAAPSSLERVALGRLAWGLQRMLRLAARLHAASGRVDPTLPRLEAALGAATLPEEYVALAKEVAAIDIPTGGAGAGASLLASIRSGLVEVARGVGAAQVLRELEQLRRTYDRDFSDDPQPLLSTLGNLAAAVVATRDASDVLDAGLREVAGGLEKLAESERDAEVRLRETQARIASATNDSELVTARNALLSETSNVVGVLAEQRAAIDALEADARTARRRAEALVAALADATSAAGTDVLTGLGNRRSLERHVAAAAQRGGRCGVLVLDIDHFKRVNDEHGHGIGDRVLAHVAALVRNELRGDDQAFRIGGEEFVAVLADCAADGALKTGERVRARVEGSPVGVLGRTLRVTVSIGVSAWVPPAAFEASVERADGALYEAKRGGRNRCASREV